MNLLGIELSDLITGSIIQLIITILIGAVLLHIATGILDFKKKSLWLAFAVVIIGGIISFALRFILSSILDIVPILGFAIGLIVYWFCIKSFYNVGWGRSIFAWLISIIVAFVISVIILSLLGISVFFFSQI